ncbi:MAG: RCC1 domain-containing protein [Gemmatimonas sp.]
MNIYMHTYHRRRVAPMMAAAMAIVVSACDVSPPDNAGARLPAVATRMNVGEWTTCALSSTQRLHCWGRNSEFFEFGVPPTTRPTSALPVNTNLFELVALMGGHGMHACGLTQQRAARCWGRNTNGQIGSGSSATTGTTLELVAVNDWSSLTVSRLTTCGVIASRRAYCWGANQRGEVGSTTRPIGSTALQPVLIESGEEFQSVSPGWLHACGLTLKGVALCWGDNNHGQLGLGVMDTVAHRVPAAVATELRFQRLSSGANYTCGITLANDAYCWGQNTMGQLGDGTTTSRALPTAVAGGFKFTRISAGTGFGSGTTVTLPSTILGAVAHTCATLAGGQAYCWGWNGAGQLGDGTFVDKTAPVAVLGALTFEELGAGGSHTCGRNNILVYCWGGNQYGQLGNGSTRNSNVPLAVEAPFRSGN